MSPVVHAVFPRAAFEVYSIHFDYSGGQAVRLKEPASDQFIGADPEWVLDPPREEVVAYVRATRPFIRVVFRGAPAANGTYSVGAGGPVEMEESRVVLAFDPVTGLSAPVDFQTRNRLPNRIGFHAIDLRWYARTPPDSPYSLTAGTSQHRICTTWREMTADATQGLRGWAYKQLMEWTCRWCEGQSDEMGICDAIIRNVGDSGLRYGINAHTVRQMLQSGGGMCGGWYQMFQQMAHCQGVFVHRRCFLVDWRSLPGGEEQWCALVIRAGGLNQSYPTHPPSEFHDNDTAFPVAGTCALSTRLEARYRFWGRPGFRRDGHCVNFLEHKGRLYLYDACFGTGPFEIDSPLPPDNFSLLGGMDLASFKARYLDGAIDYMLGTLYNGGVLLRSIRAAETNGMTVRTALIPDMIGPAPGLTFYWGD